MNSLFFFLFACGSSEQTESTEAKTSTETHTKEEHKHEDHKGHEHTMANVIDPGKISEGAKVFFVSPADGEEVTSPLKIQMGVEGMKVQPAGEIVEGTGHHHIIIDADPVKKGTAVMNDTQHLHFGKGQTETELELQPGKHTLQLQFANGAHISYGEQLRSQITITVK